MGSRFVRPDTTVLHISNGDTLTVKRQLNAGEYLDLYGRARGANGDGGPFSTIGFEVVSVFLIDWSLTDDAGNLVEIRNQPVDVVQAALKGLDSDSFVEITEAIEAHHVAMHAERNAKKKTTVGESESSPISALPSDAAGDTSGSENLILTSTSS